MIRVGDAADGAGLSRRRRRRALAQRAAAPQRPARHRRHPRQARGRRRRDARLGGAARSGARRSRSTSLRHLDVYLEQFEERCTRAGGHVHWARDADEANRIVIDIIRAHGEREIIKVKTMTSDETRLNVALEAAGIAPYETDLADLIIQLGHDRPSHIVVPALHQNRTEIRDALPAARWGWRSSADEPEDLAARGAAVPAREVPARAGRLQRRELR